MDRQFIEERQRDEFDRKIVSVRRVAKVRAGSKRLRFSSLVVAGNRKGRVGVGLGRGQDTKSAIEKGFRYAKSHSSRIEMMGDTIPHEVRMKYGAAKLILRSAGAGTGLIASSSVRSVLELAGLKNVLTKQLGAANEVTNAYCALEALKSLKKDRILQKRRKISSRKSHSTDKVENISKMVKENETKRDTKKKK